MKKTLLIIALFIGLGNVNAQNSTNVATWAETIGFIEKYQSSLRINGWICEDDLACEVENSNIQGDVWKFKYSHEYVTIDLSKLSEVTILNDAFNLEFTSKCVQIVFYRDSDSKDEVIQYSNSKTFIIYDSELQKRMIKAFQHLVYLATEKREAARKASGDKF
jgi:hypothetical protein